MRQCYFLGLLLPLLFLCSACTGDRDIRSYYFPVRELVNTEGRVYAYENIGIVPGPDTSFTYYLAVDQDTALYLSITRYGADLSPQQQSRERLLNDGMRLEQLSLLQTDTNGISQETRTELLFDRSFPFYPERAEAAGYRIRFDNGAGEGRQTYVTLNRRFRGDTTLTIMGEERAAVVFDLEGEVSLRDNVDGDISPQFTGYEIYAEGLGLVEYLRNLGEGGTLGGRLVKRYSMPEFVAIANPGSPRPPE